MGRVCNRHSSYSFTVEVQNFADQIFKKVSKIAMSVEVEEIREGGAIRPDKSPGHASVENVTLERGVTQNEDELTWFSQIAALDKNTGIAFDACGKYKRNVTVYQHDRSETKIRSYCLIDAFPVNIEIGEWDSESTDKVMINTELAYDYPKIRNLV